MAAQQNVKHERSCKKTRCSKTVACVNIVNEESTNSGIKSNSDCQSSIRNFENNVNSNNLSPKSSGKKKTISKDENAKKDVVFQNVKEVDKKSVINAVNSNLIENTSHKHCPDVNTGINSLTATEGLSKAKKRRLRKRKLQLASVPPLPLASVASSGGTAYPQDGKDCKRDNKVVTVSTEQVNKNIVPDTPVQVNTNRTDYVQCFVPLENNERKSLIENTSVLNNSPNSSTNVAANSVVPSSSDAQIYKSSIQVVDSKENKPSIEEQKITPQVFNDILHNIMQTLKGGDEIVSETCASNQSNSTVDKQGDLDVKRISLGSDLNLIDKIKEFSASFSKLESVEKLLNNSNFGEVSGEIVDGCISKCKTEKRDLTKPLQVDDSCDMLQVDDKSNIVAEKTFTRKEDSLAMSGTNSKMDENGESKSSFTITKSREDVKAEREAKKAAKLAAKKAKASGVKVVPQKISDVVDGCAPPKKSLVVIDKIIPDSDKISSEKKLPVSVGNSDLKENKQPKTVSTIKAESVGKTKAELKAERREKQEAQRAAKANKETVLQSQNDNALKKEQKENLLILPKRDTLKEKEKIDTKEVTVETKYNVKLFSHLYLEKDLFRDRDCSNIHPAVLQLGAHYEARVISGSNARCLALLHTVKRIVNDYSTPLKQEFSRGLESVLVKSMNYLNYCRPSSVSMTNAVRHIKRHLTQLPNSIPDSEARQKLYDVIDTYVREQIDVAGEAICNTVQKKINNGDVILTYGCSSLIYRILLESHKSGTKFSVVVVDGGPWFEGREMLRRLVREGLKCSYILITAASFIMREASKVLLGAHALLANGYVMSRAGTSQVALLAHSNNVPVLVCCETHKFSERVQTDAFVYNELGDPDEFLSKSMGSALDWRSYNYLTPLSIAFDVTPPDLVTAVVTELGILPCTSVPVILRIKPSETV